MILTVAAFKGGVAKTTTAIHLAAYLATKGPCVLIDGDPNRSASGWALRGGEGGLPFKVVPVALLPKVARQYEHIVIDTEARPATEDLKELVDGGDFLVIPTTPDALALEATEQTVAQLRQFDASAFAVLLTVVPPAPSKVGAEASVYLEESGIPVIRSQIPRLMVYQNAAAAGLIAGALRDPNATRAWTAYQRVGNEIESAVANTRGTVK